MKHKHCDLIKAWADGAEIQDYDYSLDKWLDSGTPMWSENKKYRIKPKTIKYRTYLIKLWDGSCTVGCCKEKNLEKSFEASITFVKWIGDWQEVEV